METLTWKEFGRLPHSLRVRGEIVFNHGPDRADIHHPLRDASVGYILSNTPPFDFIRFCRVDELPTVAARSANGGLTGNMAPIRQEAKL